MKIKNTSSKIIGVGSVSLMPDASIPVSDKVVNSPAVKAFIKKGLLTTVAEATVNESGSENKGEEKSTDKPAKTSKGKNADTAETAETASANKAE